MIRSTASFKVLRKLVPSSSRTFATAQDGKKDLICPEKIPEFGFTISKGKQNIGDSKDIIPDCENAIFNPDDELVARQVVTNPYSCAHRKEMLGTDSKSSGDKRTKQQDPSSSRK